MKLCGEDNKMVRVIKNYNSNCTLYNIMLYIHTIQIMEQLQKKKGKYTSHDIQNEDSEVDDSL